MTGSGVLLPDPIAPIMAIRDQIDKDRHRAMLDTLIAHQTFELRTLDIDALMATMVPEPQFWYYGLGSTGHLDGHEAVRDHYLKNFSVGQGQAGFECTNIAVDDGLVVQDGYVILTGGLAAQLYPDLGATLDLTIECILRKRTCILFPFLGDKMQGETVYFDGPWGKADLLI